jgi:hypothetical protein
VALIVILAVFVAGVLLRRAFLLDAKCVLESNINAIKLKTMIFYSPYLRPQSIHFFCLHSVTWSSY